MRISPARTLIILYAGITAAVFPFAALSDDVDIDGQGLFGFVVEGLIVWRLWERSKTAWFIAVALSLLMLLGVIAISMPVGATRFFLLGTVFAQLMILFSPSMRAHVRPRAARLALR